MWVLAIIKRLCPMPNFEAVKEVSVHSRTLLFGMLTVIGIL